MKVEELRKQCKHFFLCDTIDVCQELLDVYANFFFEAVINHNYDKVNSQDEADARMILQMMMTKVLHLKNTLHGVEFTSKNGKKLNNIIDPSIVAILIRNIYETVGMFNLIFRQTKDENEKEILYSLWVYSGLAYRNRFDSLITTEKNRVKMENEVKQMQNLTKRIQNNPLYIELDEKNQGKIKTAIKQKNYLIKFQNKKVEFVNWRELVNVIGIKSLKLDQIYNYFSLYAHPSNVSVFQFANLFQKEEEAYKEIVTLNLQIAFTMLSVFIADYINLFPDVLKTYEKMTLVDQISINFHNSMARGHDFDINDTWKATG